VTSDAPHLLEMRGISKRFPGVLALDGVSLELDRGEVLALVGENGAGKSTLMKILGGVFPPDAGQISIEGRPVSIPNVAAARELGIALIHQELMLAPNIDVAGNIFLGAEHRRWGGLRRLDRRSMNQAARSLLARVGLELPPATPLRRLTTGQMQMVEISKALALEARIIIMDEPTSSLTAGEAERLFSIIEDLRSSGIGIIYISHRMDEVLRIAERITVLRDGKRVGDLLARSTNHDGIVSMMVGREFSAWFPRRASQPGEDLLRVESLLVPGASSGISFTARRGEILGFAGLVGSGRTELMRVLFGIDAPQGGAIWFGGAPYHPRRPADAIRRGIYLVPEDRKLHGLVLAMQICHNISLPDISNYEPRWLLQRRTERRVALDQVSRLAIKTPSIRQRAVNLSGGNQQKVVLAKWLAMKPKLLILDEPTRGIDVGAKAEIYRHMAALADSGITILMVSSEMEEVIGMSDRVAVMHERRLTGILSREELEEESILGLMTGREEAA
jgi:ribose transport system ATP-binding protein